jgi:hypothetical protein
MFCIILHMKVQQIYKQYRIPPNLQKHMLRVTGVSQIILESWKGIKIDKKSIVLACLFHDMANIIKFKLVKPLLFKDEEEQIEFLKKVQKEFIEKYGNDVHKATLIIGKEIGLSEKVLTILKNLEWNNTQRLLNKNDYESLIPIYCDMRIGPFGIMSLQDRINNLKTRNDYHDFSEIIKFALQLEQTLQKNILIGLNSINDKQIDERFEKLLKIKY